MDGYEGLVQVELMGNVAVMELARADRANSMDGAMFAAMCAALERLGDHTQARAIVLCGRGRNFCAGGDLDHPLFSEDDEPRRRAQIAAAYEVTTRLLDHPLPIVAAIQGRCAGAGLAVALSTDVRVGARSAVFSLDYVRLGLVPDMGLCYLLASTVGTGRALEIAMTADLFNATRAQELGVLAHVVEDGSERATALEIAGRLAAHPPLGLAGTRRLVRAAPWMDRADAFAAEIDVMTTLTASPDSRARLEAFRERQRAPR